MLYIKTILAILVFSMGLQAQWMDVSPKEAVNYIQVSKDSYVKSQEFMNVWVRTRSGSGHQFLEEGVLVNVSLINVNCQDKWVNVLFAITPNEKSMAPVFEDPVTYPSNTVMGLAMSNFCKWPDKSKRTKISYDFLLDKFMEADKKTIGE